MLSTCEVKVRLPFAVIGFSTSELGITRLEYLPLTEVLNPPQSPMGLRVCNAISQYLEDPHYRFDLPLDFSGTVFQCRVWQAIARIGAGKTLTYRQLADQLNSAARAVGGACGKNPIPLIIPCHRVVAARGIGGFMQSQKGLPIQIKRWLLAHEGIRFNPD